MEGRRVRIPLGKGPRAEAFREKLIVLQRERRLDTLGEAVEFLIEQWERQCKRQALGVKVSDAYCQTDLDGESDTQAMLQSSITIESAHNPMWKTSETRELEDELNLRHAEVFKLQSMIKEIDTDVQKKKMKNLYKSHSMKVDIKPISKVNSSVQVSLPVNKPIMKDAQVSTQKCSISTSSNVFITQKTHRRTYSDGEVLQQRRDGHSFPKVTRYKDIEPQLGGASHASSLQAVGELHGHTFKLEKERPTVRSYQNNRKCNCLYQRCVWQQKAKSLQLRLKTLSEQISMLTKTKLTMSQSLEESRSASDKTRKHVKELMLRLEGHKSSLSSIQREKQELQETIHKQQKTILKLQEPTQLRRKTDVEWKRLETDQKDLRERCLTLKTNIKSLEERLEQKAVEVAYFRESNIRVERDLKQKGQLVADLKNKLKKEKENSHQIQNNFTEEVSSLSVTVVQQKHKLEILRSQLTHQTTHKERLMKMLKNCQKELEHSIQQQNISHDLHKQQKKLAAQCELSFRVRLEEMEKRHRDEVYQLECHLGESELSIQEFITFTMDLAKELSLHSPTRHLGHDSKHESDISARVREIARDTLKMSEVDLDVFFLSGKIELSEEERLEHFLNLITAIAKSKAPFASKLLEIFNEYLHG